MGCVALGWRISPSLSGNLRRPIVALAALAWLMAAMPYFHWKAILWTLPENQSFTVNKKRVQDELPVGAGVLTSEYWWALAGRNRVYDAIFSGPGPDAFGYVVLSGNGSGRAGAPLRPEVRLAIADQRGSLAIETTQHLRISNFAQRLWIRAIHARKSQYCHTTATVTHERRATRPSEIPRPPPTIRTRHLRGGSTGSTPRLPRK